MRTREITGFIQKDAVDVYEKELIGDIPFWRQPPPRPHGKYLKARLIIELPEKKVEITEQQLTDAFEGYISIATDCGKRAFENAKQKLFGKGEM